MVPFARIRLQLQCFTDRNPRSVETKRRAVDYSARHPAIAGSLLRRELVMSLLVIRVLSSSTRFREGRASARPNLRQTRGSRWGRAEALPSGSRISAGIVIR